MVVGRVTFEEYEMICGALEFEAGFFLKARMHDGEMEKECKSKGGDPNGK